MHRVGVADDSCGRHPRLLLTVHPTPHSIRALSASIHSTLLLATISSSEEQQAVSLLPKTSGSLWFSDTGGIPALRSTRSQSNPSTVVEPGIGPQSPVSSNFQEAYLQIQPRVIDTRSFHYRDTGTSPRACTRENRSMEHNNTSI
jgi:hypothetical protein